MARAAFRTHGASPVLHPLSGGTEAGQGRGQETSLCLVREEERPRAMALNLICSASVTSVAGGFKCWISELFLGKVFPREKVFQVVSKS